MKKHYLLSLLLLCSFLISCGQPPSSALTVTMSLGEEEWKVFREDIFPRFEKKHGITINAHQIEAQHLPTKLLALSQANQMEIDLFAQDNMTLSTLVNKNLVEDLSDFEGTIASEVMSNIIQSCKFNGKLLFMPFRPNVQIVYYNTAAFRRHNLDAPQNWEELLQAAKIFHEKEGMGRILFKGYGGNPTATIMYEFILQAGGDPYAFNDKGCIRAFSYLQELAPYLSVESQRAKWDTTNDILSRQEAYLAVNWPFGVVILLKNYGLDFIDTYHGWKGPAGEHHVIGGDVWGIPQNSPQKELALQFIFFVQSKEIQEILIKKLGWPSIREDVYTAVPDWQKPHFESVRQALKKGVFRKNVAWWPVYKKYINLAFQDIVKHRRPVQETLDRYKQLMEKEKSHF